MIVELSRRCTPPPITNSSLTLQSIVIDSTTQSLRMKAVLPTADDLFSN